MHTNRASMILWDQIVENLTSLRTLISDGTLVTGGAAIAAVRQAAEVTPAAEERVATVHRNKDLTDEGKYKAILPILDKASEDLTAQADRAREIYQKAIDYHESRIAWPRSNGPDADREARLANARADLHRLVDGTTPGNRAARLAFAARQGDEAMRELIFGERYPERILWPSQPADSGNVDALEWALIRTDTLKEVHPNAGTVATSLDALTAFQTTGQHVLINLEHAADMDMRDLNNMRPQRVSGFGVLGE